MATSIFELKVKALAQPLGSENAWNELGDGRVSFVGYTIRVVASMSASMTREEMRDEGVEERQPPQDEKTDAESQQESACPVAKSRPPSGDDERAVAQMMVVLEDCITDETPFVGENCCIVWNSIDQELSLCMMFASEYEYQAAWSALAAVQHKPYPPLGRDLFIAEKGEDGEASLKSDSNTNEDLSDPTNVEPKAIPYREILSSSIVPNLSFIERHAVALSLLEFGHLSRTELYEDSDVCVALLKLGHADLLEHLVAPSVYSMFVAGLDPSTPPPPEWNVPTSLKATLVVSSELELCLRTALCLHHLKHEVLPLGIEEDVLAIIDGVNHRLQNEAACSLLADDTLIRCAVDELNVVPVEDLPTRMSRSTTPTEAAQASPLTQLDSQKAKEMPPKLAEEHVADHLRFFSSLISLSITAFAKELVAPVMGKIFSHDLLEALSNVADRFTVGTMAPVSLCGLSRQASPENQAPLSRPGSSNINRPAPPAKEANRTSSCGRPPRHLGARMAGRVYSPRVEAELSRLLDSTLVRLNEKQEEVAVNDFFRIPILDNPEKFAGIVSFLLRQMLSVPQESELGRSIASERGIGNNSLLLFHLLGMHDDEGSSSSDRLLDPENDVRRNDFHAYVIKSLIGPSCKGLDIASASATPSTSPMAVPPSSPAVCAAPPHTPTAPVPTPPKPSTMAPPLVRLMEYLLRLASYENRELLLLRIFDPTSVVLGYIEQSFKSATEKTRSAPALDVLCGHLRFLKAILSCICGPIAAETAPKNAQHDGVNLDVAIGDISTHNNETHLIPPSMHRGMDRKILALAAKVLTIDRQTFGIMVELYSKTGGTRKQGLVHCTIRSLLQMLATTEGQNAENLSTLLMIKYRAQLPKLFIDSVEKRILEGVLTKLDVMGVVKPSGRNSASPILVYGVSNLDVSAASSSPQQSPLGRYLVDELASPPDAKQMEDLAAFPKKLRQAIGRLSPTPRGLHLDEGSSGVNGDGSPSAKSELYLIPIPKGSSPLVGALASSSPLPSASKLDLERVLEEPVIDASTAKPTAPKQAKTSGGRGSNGRHLGDGKPLMRSK